MSFYNVIRPLIFKLDEECSHNLAIKALSVPFLPTKAGCSAAHNVINSKKFNIKIASLDFPNILGLAAGFDKNAEALRGISNLGFGFIEIGTVTPRPQEGNAKPRLFRLPNYESLINRMGFNNAGSEIIYANLNNFLKQSQQNRPNIIGVNIGVNKDSIDRISDYLYNIGLFYDIASYFTINISSPNTPQLRDLQLKDNLSQLIHKISKFRLDKFDESQNYVPIFLKISPDLTDEQLQDIADLFKVSDLDAIIVSNTTISRDEIEADILSQQAGGLSGRALFEKSTKILANMRKLLGKDKIIIAAGGVDGPERFLQKIKAGADLVQLYTALIFKGPQLPFDILNQTLNQMLIDKVEHISHYRDAELQNWLN